MVLNQVYSSKKFKQKIQYGGNVSKLDRMTDNFVLLRFKPETCENVINSSPSQFVILNGSGFNPNGSR